MSAAIKEPIDLLRMSLDDVVVVKCRGERELRGKLHAFDSHLNMILSDVLETETVISLDSDSVKQNSREIPMMFLRGDLVILVSLPVGGAQ